MTEHEVYVNPLKEAAKQARKSLDVLFQAAFTSAPISSSPERTKTT